MKIRFNSVFQSDKYNRYMADLFSDYEFFRNKKYSALCQEELALVFGQNTYHLLTHSATGGLEMIAKAMDIRPGDEIIMPSFTFVSTANAFVSHGAIPVFADISISDFNLAFTEIEKKISEKTRAVVVTHYGGHSTNLDAIRQLCDAHQLIMIEDAAMAFGNSYNGQPLGTIGDMGVISFDITKQISAIQGGVLLVNTPDFMDRLDAIYHIGTNRTRFETQKVPYYEWIDTGSKYQMNELNAVALYDNLLNRAHILNKRKELSRIYFNELSSYADLILPEHKLQENIHLFYLLARSEEEREALRHHLSEKGIEAMFHYIPLHTSKMGKKFPSGTLPVTDHVSGSLLRLPLHTGMTEQDVVEVCDAVKRFYNGR